MSKITRTISQFGKNYLIEERVEELKRMCYDLWQRCVGCPSALGCRDCRYQELEIRKYYPTWYAQLLWYRKNRKNINGKRPSLIIIDEVATEDMEGGDKDGVSKLCPSVPKL